MSGQQRVIHQRRQYNQWVGNQTLEDYALRYTASRARRWSAFRVGNMALGAVSFLACEAIGGSITLAFGFTNAMLAIVATGILMFLIGLPICISATRHGVDVDLLTRGAGFGYIGSTITSLIYASFTFILFSIEASIMSAAINMVLGTPFWLANIISALVVIPIAAYGVKVISRMQLWTQYIWLSLQFGPLLYLAFEGLPDFSAWSQFTGSFGTAGFSLLPFGMASSILLSLLPQVGEQVDYLRFLPERAKAGRVAWWSALLFSGPGWVIVGCAKIAAGSFLTYLAVERGVAWEQAAQPATMYQIALTEVFHNKTLAAALMLIFVVTCQIKINTTNAYAGSIAWSNFFSRLTHSHPGRVVWVVFNVLLALLLMELGIFRVLQSILGLYANFACGWMGALAADLLINKRIGLSPPGIEFKRAHLHDINPVGVGAMAVSVVVSTAMSFGYLGAVPHALAPFFALLIAFILAPTIAYLTEGKYYLARQDTLPADGSLQCVVCNSHFERPDMAFCPAYQGSICSLCCSLDARCHDLCKPDVSVSRNLLMPVVRILPERMQGFLDDRIVRFLGMFAVFAGVIGIVLTVIGFEYRVLAPASEQAAIHGTLWAVFAVLFILSGIAAWLLVLAQSSRRAAEEESSHQNHMLMEEIAAHERTDDALKKAKAVAESANTAKSRYIVGVIHEIRAPLNAIFGYAQLLERGSSVRPEDAVRVIRRSTEHLSNLVDGLLDISQIETGSLQLHRDRVNLPEFLDQIVDMFRLSAAAKGIGFHHERPANLPRLIQVDEKRLRQILINLLSNGVKYTKEGHVTLRVRMRGLVAEFEVHDTGLGIRPEDIEKIFEPFERGHMPASNAIPGTGLGLTISKLLTQILGGEISVESRMGEGSVFRVRLLLSEVTGAAEITAPERRATGYTGSRRRVLAVDDDADQLELLSEILIPLGFDLLTLPDAEAALAEHQSFAPDLVIFDIAMPGISGLDAARRLRALQSPARIMILSGNFHDVPQSADIETKPDYDAFLAKPVDIRAFLDKVQSLLGLSWVFGDIPSAPAPVSKMHWPETSHIEDLLQLGRIGYVRGIEAKLDEISEAAPETMEFTLYMRDIVRGFDLQRFMDCLETRNVG